MINNIIRFKRGTAMLPRLSWRSKETFGAYMITAAHAIT